MYWIHKPEDVDFTNFGYIGVTARSVDERYKQHKSDASSGSKLSVHNAIRKYGDKLVVDTLVEGSEEYCYMIEQKLRPTAHLGWNIRVGGADTSMTGVTHSEETRKKMSEAKKGWTPSEELRRLVSENMKGRKKSPVAVKARSDTVLQEPWRGAPESNRVLWLHADDIYKRVLVEGESKRRVALSYGFRPNSLDTMLSKFKTGWLPQHDSTWNAYVSSNLCNRFTDDELLLMKSTITDNRKPLPDWMNPSANKSVWAIANRLRDYIRENPEHGAHRIGKAFGLTQDQVTKVSKKLKSGWNPSEDAAYLAWLAKYKSEQEAINETFA